jgi:pimeloyl-ACP methyl ester carboxylesterase
MNSPKRAATSHTYFSQRLKLHYLDWGNPNAPTLLLIHGSQDHCHNWDWTAEQFYDDYHVIVPDLRGHGDSEWVTGSPYQLLDYVYDIAQLVHQQDFEELNVIGHSLGGSIACLFAGIYPERVKRLVSIEGVGGVWYTRDDQKPQQRIREWMSGTRELAGRVPRKYPTLDEALARMVKSNPHLSPERAEHLTIHGSNRNEDGSYSWKFDNYTHSGAHLGMNYEDLTQLWEKIDCPTLLLNAKQGFEHRTGQDGSLKHFKQGNVVDIDQAGHWLHHDQFDQFIDESRRFMTD